MLKYKKDCYKCAFDLDSISNHTSLSVINIYLGTALKSYLYWAPLTQFCWIVVNNSMLLWFYISPVHPSPVVFTTRSPSHTVQTLYAEHWEQLSIASPHSEMTMILCCVLPTMNHKIQMYKLNTHAQHRVLLNAYKC